MEMSNWDAISAIAEVVGVVGLIASLIFVGFQMKQTAKAINVSSNHGIQEALRDMVMRIAENESLTSVFMQGMAEPESASAIDEYRFALTMQATIQFYANAYYQHSVGALDETTWQSIDAQLGNGLKSPGAQAYWARRGSNYPKDFETYLKDQVFSSPQQEGYRWEAT